MAVDLGEVVTRRVIVRTAAGVATDADSLPSYSVTLPSGSAGIAPTVTHTATGTYAVDYPTVASGLHYDTFSAIVGGKVVIFGPDAFTVRAASPGPILGLAEARKILNVGSDTSRDELIRDYLDAATELCEDYTGRAFRRRTMSETFSGGKTGVVLSVGPVQSITTVTENGTAVPSTGYLLDAARGVLYRGTTLAPVPWQIGLLNVSVTYVTGSSTVSARIRQAVRVTLMHIWATQQGGASNAPRRAVGASVDEYDNAGAGAAWSLPHAAEELLLRDMGAGFA
jgi:uncharacterized phiE125 gp8 family phage protein